MNGGIFAAQRPKHNRDRIFCLVGRSGSGKSHISDEMEKLGWTAVASYTTRAKRKPNEKHHTFVDQSGFDSVRHEIIGHTVFDGYEYGATKTQIHNSHIYVVDPRGIEVLSQYLGRHNIFVVYLDVSYETRLSRMTEERGTSAAWERVKHDEEKFASYSDYDVLLPNDNLKQLSRNIAVVSALLESCYKINRGGFVVGD